MDEADAQTTTRQAAGEDKPTGYPRMQCAEGEGEGMVWGNMAFIDFSQKLEDWCNSLSAANNASSSTFLFLYKMDKVWRKDFSSGVMWWSLTWCGCSQPLLPLFALLCDVVKAFYQTDVCYARTGPLKGKQPAFDVFLKIDIILVTQ